MFSALSRRKAVLVGIALALAAALTFAAVSGTSRQRAMIQGDAIPGVDVSIEQTPSGIAIAPPASTGTAPGPVGAMIVSQSGEGSLFPPSSNNYNSSKSNSAIIIASTQSGGSGDLIDGGFGPGLDKLRALSTDPTSSKGYDGPKQLAIACFVDPGKPSGPLGCWMTDWEAPAGITKAISPAGWASRVKGETDQAFFWHKVAPVGGEDGALVEATGGATVWDGVWLVEHANGPRPVKAQDTSVSNIKRPSGVKASQTAWAFIDKVDNRAKASFGH